MARALSLGLVTGWTAILLTGTVAAAQETPAPPQQPQTPPSAPPTAPPIAPPTPERQQPGAGADVRTGTNTGIDLSEKMLNLFADHQFFRIADELDELPPEQSQLYSGILANRANDAKRSIKLLEPLVDRVAATGNTEQEKLIRKALAEDYLRAGDLGKAATAYQTLETHLGGKLTGEERDEIEMPLKMLPLAKQNPPMTVEPCDPFVMHVSKDPLGLTDIPVFVDAMPHSWMLDPTAPFNLIARSLAREVGLKVSTEAVTIHTLTGKPMQVHVTMVPRFTIGGRLTLRNMTAFVFEDADYFFSKNRYQVQGVLGYPALQALGSLTITADATIEVRPSRELDREGKDLSSVPGAHFFLDGDQVILGLGSAGNERMFIVDAGGQQSYFSSRYYAEHASEFAGQKMQLFTVPGDVAREPQPAFVAETVPLNVGGTVVKTHYIQVLTQPLGDAVLDDVYGVLGVDVLDQFRRYTFDYRTMRFTVGQEDGAQ